VLRIICGRSESLVTIELSTGEYLQATEEHEMWVEGRGWTSAAELVAGDRLLGAEGEDVEVVAIWRDQTSAPVYNLHVEDAHTYFAAGVWVHNDNCPTLDEVFSVAMRLHPTKTGYTQVGHGIKKHIDRHHGKGKWGLYPAGKKNPQAWNDWGEWQIMDVLTSPSTRAVPSRSGAGGWKFQEMDGARRSFMITGNRNQIRLHD
jgi:hypothetical protein